MHGFNPSPRMLITEHCKARLGYLVKSHLKKTKKKAPEDG